MRPQAWCGGFDALLIGFVKSETSVSRAAVASALQQASRNQRIFCLSKYLEADADPTFRPVDAAEMHSF
jgi:hypothetical protein